MNNWLVKMLKKTNSFCILAMNVVIFEM